jgi:hypothetical protein
MFAWKTSKEMSKIQNELNEKASEIKHLQLDLTRRQNEEAGEAFNSLKRLIETLEMENTSLKVGRFILYLFNCNSTSFYFLLSYHSQILNVAFLLCCLKNTLIYDRFYL